MSEEYQTGYVPNPEATAAIVASLPHRSFASTPAGQGAAVDVDAFAWRPLAKLMGVDKLPARDQGQVGSCVGNGSATAVDVTAACEIVLAKQPETYKARVAADALYGECRTISHDLSGGDGSYGGAAANAIRQYGTLHMLDYGPAGDFRKYSATKCKTFNRQAVPGPLLSLAGAHKMHAATLVATPEEARTALQNGYGISVCSNQGFTSTRDADGFARAQGSWSHCVLPDAMIAGNTMRRADAVAVGDFVYGHDGKQHEIKQVYTREFDGTLVRIKASGLPGVSFTDEHPVLIYRRARRVHGTHRKALLAVGTSITESTEEPCYQDYRRFETAWVSAKDIRPGDYLVTPKIKQQSSIVPDGLGEASEELAWLFGVYIGDGHADRDHKITITLGNRKPINRVAEAFRLLGVEATVYREKTFARVVVYNAQLANLFLEWFGHGSANKHVPEWLMTWDAESVLGGLCAADGGVYKNRHYLTTVSPILAQQFRLLLASTGQRCSYALKQPGKGAYANGKTQHTFEWTPSNSRGIRPTDFVAHKVQTVFLVAHRGTVYNYEVEGVNSYVADGVCVHNCMAIVGYRAGKRRGFLIVNSWGNDWITGPVYPADMPLGSFWADWDVVARMMAGRDSFAYGDYDGFRSKRVDFLEAANTWE